MQEDQNNDYYHDFFSGVLIGFGMNLALINTMTLRRSNPITDYDYKSYTVMTIALYAFYFWFQNRNAENIQVQNSRGLALGVALGSIGGLVLRSSIYRPLAQILDEKDSNPLEQTRNHF